MTRFDQKVAEAQRWAKKPTTMDPGYKRAVWRLMIACGGASWYQASDEDFERRAAALNEEPSYTKYRLARELTNYYGGTVAVELGRTIDYTGKIEFGLVDWEASDDPAQDYGGEFRGTFADEQGSFPYLAGKLVFTDGTYTWWAVQAGEDGDDFGGIVRAITALDLTDEEAVEHLLSRLTDPEAAWHFQYNAKLPRGL